MVYGLSGWCFGTCCFYSIIPTDELIFFSGVGIPPTRYSIFFRLSMILEKSTVSWIYLNKEGKYTIHCWWTKMQGT
jgi:hypothetical protein